MLDRWRCLGDTPVCATEQGAWKRPPHLEEGPRTREPSGQSVGKAASGQGSRGVQVGGPKQPLLPLPPGPGQLGSAGQGGLAGAPRAPASYPTAPQAHVSSSASSPRALPPRGPCPSACGANGLTGAPSDSAFLQREDREGSGRRAAGSTASAALGRLRAAGTQAGPREASLGWGCGSAGLPRGRVARQLP